MTQAVLFTALIPISLMMVFGMIWLGGSLSAARRRLIERAVILIAFPGAALLWAVRGVNAWAEQDWIWVAASLGLVVLMAVSAVRLWRKPVRADGTRN
jgi:hypothetical protein